MILLVVNMHACVTYSNVGSWYVNSPRALTMGQRILFILWQAHLQSFFMGILFFVSGYFASGSLGRRGPAGFMRERLFRLGLPALLYMLVIHPFIVRGIDPWHEEFPPVLAYYGQYLRSGRFLGATGPLWFAVALLIFSAFFASSRALAGGAAAEPAPGRSGLPSMGTILLYVLGTGIATFAVRLVQPLGTDVLNMQLGYFVQYIAAFAAGVAAARKGWLLPLASSSRAAWSGGVMIFLGPASLLALLVAGTRSGSQSFQGGWHWAAFSLALWEQVAGVGLSLGLLRLFAASMNRDNLVLRWMADRSFGVYVLHPPVIIWLYLLLPLSLSPFALAFLMTVLGLAITFVLADVARRTPGLRAIL
jgi:glucan biosynthesis protein C